MTRSRHQGTERRTLDHWETSREPREGLGFTGHRKWHRDTDRGTGATKTIGKGRRWRTGDLRHASRKTRRGEFGVSGISVSVSWK